MPEQEPADWRAPWRQPGYRRGRCRSGFRSCRQPAGAGQTGPRRDADAAGPGRSLPRQFRDAWRNRQDPARPCRDLPAQLRRAQAQGLGPATAGRAHRRRNAGYPVGRPARIGQGVGHGQQMWRNPARGAFHSLPHRHAAVGGSGGRHCPAAGRSLRDLDGNRRCRDRAGPSGQQSGSLAEGAMRLRLLDGPTGRPATPLPPARAASSPRHQRGWTARAWWHSAACRAA